MMCVRVDSVGLVKQRSMRKKFIGMAIGLALLSGTLPGQPAVPVAAEQNEQPGSPYAASIAAGNAHTCVVLTAGNVRCWGANADGELGIESTATIGDNESPTEDAHLGGARATAIAAGFQHTCALLVGGAVRCWGLNQFGQLGLGHTMNIGDDEPPTSNVNLAGATATAVTAGSYHTCALLTGGAVRCWGLNATGQLGIASTATIGDNESPSLDVDLGGATATAITASENHTCALLSTGAVRCWGSNGSGQLGLDRIDGTVIGDNESPTIDADLGGATATAVSAGQGYTCADLLGGTVRCWGNNSLGQLGLPTARFFGNVDLGAQTATAIATSSQHTCVLLSSANVRCWGSGNDGRLGIARSVPVGQIQGPTIDVNLGGATVTAVTSGGSHTCALLAGGALRCWGFGLNGQLGLGNTASIGDDEIPAVNVNLGGATVGPIDTTKPVVAISTPTPDSSIPATPVVISGTASDIAGVQRVGVAIYRFVGAAQYWNGSGWQSANTTVTATLNVAGARTTTWTYTFDAPPGGVFAVAAMVTSINGSISTAPYQTLRVADSTKPTASFTSPTPGQLFTDRPVRIAGSATDNSGVAEVRLVIYRPVEFANNPQGGQFAGQYWDGTDWQLNYRTVSAALADPGATATDFSYAFTPPQSGGLFYVAAIPIDTSYNYALSEFRTFTLPDSTPPTATFQYQYSKPPGVLTISGTATDDISINSVRVAFYDVNAHRYIGLPADGDGFKSYPIGFLGYTPGPTVTFAQSFVVPSGEYLVAVLPIDGNYNYSLTPFVSVTVP